VNVLFATQGKYGERIASFVAANRPQGWKILRLPLPRILPVVIDDPDEVLPAALPATDLLVSLHESPEAADTGALRHHHHPCMASMEVDPELSDTLMHLSGYIFRAAINAGLQRK
jgi:hypothetical protein